MNKILNCLTLGLLLISCNTNSGTTPLEKIDYVVNKAYENGDFTGSVLVANKGEVLYQKNLGMADSKQGIPVSDSTKFLIASISKSITAILILQLVEQGKIGLEDPLSNFFVFEKDSKASKITIHQLLTHTSGIKELINEEHVFEEADLKRANFEFESGSDFKYSNTGYVILKEVALRTSGKDYEELIREVSESAQLNSLGVAKDEQYVDNLAVGYKGTKQVESKELGYSFEIIHGTGSLYATVNDLFKLDRALYTEKLLSKKSVELMHKQHVKGRFGYGWFLRERGGTWDIMYHEGDLPGYTSFISRRTKHDEVVILLSNVEGLDLSGLESDISRILKFDN